MRRTACAVAMILAACAADENSQSESELNGKWMGRVPVAVAGIEMSLQDDGGVVSGRGEYFISGPRPTGTFSVSGTHGNRSVALFLRYDSGSRASFQGRLESPSRIDGVYAQAGANESLQMTLSRVAE